MAEPINPSLQVHHFAEFHCHVHGSPPFDWQTELLRKVVDERRWPRVLDLPTGAGKTTCIDIALFALALDADPVREPHERWCPRRIAMVVDRRIVVDQVAGRGRKLLRALTEADAPPVVAEVARRLKSIVTPPVPGGSVEPLGVFTLRGGVPRDDGWARSPDQPLVIASTVDQLGSRLLMQGYGVTDSMKPVHTGLAANDILILLDEVHLSQGFADTLDALERLRERHAASGIRTRFHHAFLSATPGKTATEPFSLDLGSIRPGSVLNERLNASKPARLLEVAADMHERTCALEAVKLSERHGTVAVVVNRVAAASRIAEDIRNRVNADTRVVLLTGRMRPLDRDDLLREVDPLIRTGRSRENAQRVIVVATQCIEAGADFDFDALVTEAASLSALRQRFGRLDRLGRYGEARGVIIRNKGLKDDLIYGETTIKTWAWLKEIANESKEVDFGIRALPLPPEDQLREMSQTGEDQRAPVLLPAYLDLWAQTAPPPAALPEVALWLHGAVEAPADVQVVWRADLSGDLLQRAKRDRNTLKRLIETVGAIRPSSLEALAVPISAARKWLRQDEPGDMADVERAVDEDFTPGAGSDLALCWDGEKSRIVDARTVRPGDTIIVPATRGGIRGGTFDARATEPVSDLAERAALLSRGQPMLRLHPAILKQFGLPSNLADTDDIFDALERFEPGEAPWKNVWAEHLRKNRLKQVVVDVEEYSILLEGRRISAARLRERLHAYDTIEDGAEYTTDDETSSHSGQPQRLAEHCGAVERLARAYAGSAGLPPQIVNDIALAAWLHDIGKVDRRFQIMLHGGDEIGYLNAEEPLAKSGMSRSERLAQRLAQRKSGYPERARHELQSVALIEASFDAVRSKAHDPDLVLHLIASHHGHCRPFAPIVEDGQPIEVSIAVNGKSFGAMSFRTPSSRHDLHRIDSPLADRFWRVVERYGWQELCWFESILRLADHRASEASEPTQERNTP